MYVFIHLCIISRGVLAEWVLFCYKMGSSDKMGPNRRVMNLLGRENLLFNLSNGLTGIDRAFDFENSSTGGR